MLKKDTKRKLQDGQYNNEILRKSEIIKDMMYLRDRNDFSFLEKVEIVHITRSMWKLRRNIELEKCEFM
jgi:hypothetical protein